MILQQSWSNILFNHFEKSGCAMSSESPTGGQEIDSDIELSDDVLLIERLNTTIIPTSEGADILLLAKKIGNWSEVQYHNALFELERGYPLIVILYKTIQCENEECMACDCMGYHVKEDFLSPGACCHRVHLNGFTTNW